MSKKEGKVNRRVELMVHTEYGDADSICSLKKTIQRACDIGLGGIAITDHMSILSFPELSSIHKEMMKTHPDFKIIYGLTATVLCFDDSDKVENPALPFSGLFDTTGCWSSHQVSILVRDSKGLGNLYRLVSERRNDLMYGECYEEDVLLRYREGLLIGTGTYKGELFDAIINKNDDKLESIVNKYDYLEIQPTANCRSFIYDEMMPYASEAKLRDINKKIIDLGKKYSKPVVVTGDVRFLETIHQHPYSFLEYVGFNETQRDRVRLIKKELDDPRYLRTLEEMSKEFSYLEEEDRKKVLIDDTCAVADMIDSKCIPDEKSSIYNFDGGIDYLIDECKSALEKEYGADIQDVIKDRFDEEIDIIKKYGYESYYILAKKITEMAIKRGCKTKIRDYSGGSFIAYLLGVTGINPLPGHYYCRECHYVSFPNVNGDMFVLESEDKLCPNCKSRLDKRGFDLPCELFMGADGEKLPNFNIELPAGEKALIIDDLDRITSGVRGTVWHSVLKSKSMMYENELMKYNKVTRGTVGEPHENNSVLGMIPCVRRKTDLHPATIVILPNNMDKYEITPFYKGYFEKKENDNKARYLDHGLTYFDKYFLEGRLLSISLYENNAVEMLADLEKRTGVKTDNISLYDDEIIKVFILMRANSKIKKSGKYKGINATVGLNYTFSDSFTCYMENKEFEWFGSLFYYYLKSQSNEDCLSASFDIVDRERLFMRLKQQGVPKEKALGIINKIVKYGFLSDDEEAYLEDRGSDDNQLFHLNKVYKLPSRSQGLANILCDWYLAFYKLNYPLEFYASYFSFVNTSIDYKVINKPYRDIVSVIKQIKEKPGVERTKEDKKTLKDYLVLKEMYDRGFEFAEMDFSNAEERYYTVTTDKKIMPSLFCYELD